VSTPLYPSLAVLAVLAVVALERWHFRSGIFRSRAYWISMTIVFAFMVPVDGWLSKLSAPIVIFNDDQTSGWRPIWDILAEEFLYAFALLTLVILCWDRAGDREAAEREEQRERKGHVERTSSGKR
jgi:lycopene cyclase domain-containing protein